ncbi:hypothetical protein Dda_5098 [Drechslerella dactyloides]|uniref:BZIP domain-containing protein n=1 Tax=Drechslerella dactyloides TaxID=74499 RepID=A0AAD6IVZ9_DREDA|nr:hypothetical protein Dda_5098 [Drechslerella dactyloides]
MQPSQRPGSWLLPDLAGAGTTNIVPRYCRELVSTRTAPDLELAPLLPPVAIASSPAQTFLQEPPAASPAKIPLSGEFSAQSFKISPSTDPPRFAQAQENPPGWHPQATSTASPHSPALAAPPQTAAQAATDAAALFTTFNQDFELFDQPQQPPAQTSHRLSVTSHAIPDHHHPSAASIGDAVFNLGYTTSLPTSRNWSAAAAAVGASPATPSQLVQRSPFVTSAAAPEFNPALIETLSDNHRISLIRGSSPPRAPNPSSQKFTPSRIAVSSLVIASPVVVRPSIGEMLRQSDSLESLLQRDMDEDMDEDVDLPTNLHSPPSFSSSRSSSFSIVLNNPPAEFTRRQKHMEDELLTMAGLEASPHLANDMTFSPNNPLFHDFSPFVGGMAYTGRTNETLDDSPTGLDTPLFGADDAVLDDWTPLFSSEEQFNFNAAAPNGTVPMEHTPSTDGTLINPAALMLNDDSSATPPLAAVVPSRQLSDDSHKSHTPPSPSTKSMAKGSAANPKRASLNGVNRRKAVTDLPPVQFDPTNPVDIKRARNTMAARKSRARRVEKMEELADTVEKLQAEAQQLKEEREYYKTLARQHGALVD